MNKYELFPHKFKYGICTNCRTPETNLPGYYTDMHLCPTILYQELPYPIKKQEADCVSSNNCQTNKS